MYVSHAQLKSAMPQLADIALVLCYSNHRCGTLCRVATGMSDLYYVEPPAVVMMALRYGGDAQPICHTYYFILFIFLLLFIIFMHRLNKMMMMNQKVM